MVTITTIQAKAITSWLRRVSPKGDDDRRALVAMVEELERKAARSGLDATVEVIVERADGGATIYEINREAG